MYRFAWREPDGSPIMYEADLLRGCVGRVGKDRVRELRRAFVHHPPPSGPVRLGDIGPTTNIRWQLAYERRGALYWWDYTRTVGLALEQSLSAGEALGFEWAWGNGEIIEYVAGPVRCVVRDVSGDCAAYFWLRSAICILESHRKHLRNFIWRQALLTFNRRKNANGGASLMPTASSGMHKASWLGSRWSPTCTGAAVQRPAFGMSAAVVADHGCSSVPC